nr:hypothetical protein [Tanacetum cinerariifolium]
MRVPMSYGFFSPISISISNTHPVITRAKDGISKPINQLSLHTNTTSPLLRSHIHALRDQIGKRLCISIMQMDHLVALDVKNAFLHGYYHRHFTCINLLASSSAFLHRVIPSLHGEFAMTDLVQQVCLYIHDPRELHLAALKRILRYVCGTIDHGLQLHVLSTILHTDADWVGFSITRRSTTALHQGINHTRYQKDLFLEVLPSAQGKILGFDSSKPNTPKFLHLKGREDNVRRQTQDQFTLKVTKWTGGIGGMGGSEWVVLHKSISITANGLMSLG